MTVVQVSSLGSTSQPFRIENHDYMFTHSTPRSTAPENPHLSSTSALGGLPRDIWDAIFAHLLPFELVTLAQLNSTFYKIVVTSLSWRFFRGLFPTSRRIWALTWKEALDGYFARTIPPTGSEKIISDSYLLTLPKSESFSASFIGTNRRIIEFFGPSVRHRHDTFLTQTVLLTNTCQSWRIRSTPKYSMGEIVSVQKFALKLPPRAHHLKPAGLDVVGTCVYWVDYEDCPLPFTINENGIHFGDGVEENALWPPGIFDDSHDEEPCLLHKLFLSWGESEADFSGQMVCALDGSRLRASQKVFRFYDYETFQAYAIPFEKILGSGGPWLGQWREPWLLPWGTDDDGNLLFKIIDTRLMNDVEVVRCVQTSFNVETMSPIFTHEILEDVQLTHPWNFQVFSDQCWGYPAKDGNGDVWCVLRDLRDGNLVRRVGPLNKPGTKPNDYYCRPSMFHVIFQDRSQQHSPTANSAPLRIFPIKPISPAVRHEYRLPGVKSRLHHDQLLYELNPPPHPNPPAFWIFDGEDASERYLLFRGVAPHDDASSDDWKKLIIWDSYRREWTVSEWEAQRVRNTGICCLFSEIDGEKERVGLDWICMELEDD